MPRLDEILMAIARIDGFGFQDLSIVLLKKEYPNLNALPPQRDLGQDAVIPPFLSPAGRSISVAISKDTSWSKLEGDCLRCRQKGHLIDVMVFATAGAVTNEKRQEWADKVKAKFGWELVVHDQYWLRSVVEMPAFEAAIETILGVPPPAGDFSSTVLEAISRETEESQRGFSDSLPTVGHIPRTEVNQILETLTRCSRALVRGEAGTGKSGLLRRAALELEKQGPVCYIDSRRVAYIRSDAELSNHFRLRSPIAVALQRVATNVGRCSLVVDQLESVAQSAAGPVLHRLLEASAGKPGIVSLTACRPWDLSAVQAYRSLVEETGFEVVDCLPLDPDVVRGVLVEVGVSSPPPELVELGRNLLHLSSIIEIVIAEPERPISSLRTSLAVWDRYREMLVRRERSQEEAHRGEEIVAAAVALARRSLCSDGGAFSLQFPPRQAETGLLSLGIIHRSSAGTYHFRHDEMRDYFYAWDAGENRQLMPSQVAAEIPLNSRGIVFDWMIRIYATRYPMRVGPFAKEAFGV